MKIAFVLSFALLATGCSHQTIFYGRHTAALTSSNCPPGHRWSDGKCHDTGKGHDPAKHAK